MKEISLNILDVAKNSVKANATLIQISLDTDGEGWMTLTIEDDGCGMEEDVLKGVTDPFFTTRKTRKVGMGLPLLKMASELTGGGLTILSSTDPNRHGTRLKATFQTKSIDCMPMGDIVSTVCILIAGSPQIDFVFQDRSPDKLVQLDTRELRMVLGEDISLSEPEIQQWIAGYLEEQYQKNETTE